MFGTLPLLAHSFQQATCYAPQVSSPLSSSPLHTSPLTPRDGNSPQPPRQLQFLMSSPTLGKNRKENPYSKRVTRSNPLIHNRGNGRETRRKLFLKKVREDSEDKRWDARGGDDEMMRMIWIAEEKRRAERQARDASDVPASQEEEELEQGENEEAAYRTAQRKDEEMVDEVAQQEAAEMEALLSMEAESRDQPPEPYEKLETPYGSDDEEYDYIFLNVINEEETRSNNKSVQAEDTGTTDPEMMDMT